MPRIRRVISAASAVAVIGAGASAAQASAAAVAVNVGCVVYGNSYSDPAIPIIGSGFTPGRTVTLATLSAHKPTPSLLGSALANAAGSFGTVTGAAIFNSFKTQEQTFTLVASDGVVSAQTTFRQVRGGYTRVPSPRRPRSKVKHIVRGFTPGKTVWAHFRHGGKTRVTKRIGVAQGPCGVATRRMRALPTKSRLGVWRVYVDHERRFSLKSRPQARLSFSVYRRFS